MANLRANRITSTEVFETTGSVQFDGSGDYLSLASNSDFQFGSNDYTIESWIYLKSLSSIPALFGRYNTSSARELYVVIGNDGSIAHRTSPDGINYTTHQTLPGLITTNKWIHIAISKSGINSYISVDGTVYTGTVNSTLHTSSQTTYVGSVLPGTLDNYFNGHISNLRVLKGQALYTENFTPPTRELEVIPNTVLLACQSTTKADEEKTGKTITVNGNAVANELTPGLLINVVKSGGSSAITGSVEFDGTGDYLNIPDNEGFNMGTGDFTLECWVNSSDNSDYQGIFGSYDYDSAMVLFQISNTGVLRFVNPGAIDITGTTNLRDGGWHHIVMCRSGSTLRGFVDGIQEISTTYSSSIDWGHNNNSIVIGIVDRTDYPGQYEYKGFISNLRIIKGTALYTSNFIPPTRNLTKLPGTVLLCCQDSNDPTTEATGKTITGYGDLQKADGVELVTNGTFDTDVSGWTTYESTNTWSSGKMQITRTGGGGRSTYQTFTTVPGYVYTINSEVNSVGSRGDIYIMYGTGWTNIDNPLLYLAGTSGQTRILSGHFTATTTTTTLAFAVDANGTSIIVDNVSVTKLDPGNRASDFTPSVGSDDSVEFAGPTTINTENYFYLPTGPTEQRAPVGNYNAGTRGVFGGGRAPGEVNVIDYITISSTGDAQDFGDLTTERTDASSFSSATRGVYAGGYGTPTLRNIIDYVTISSTGNAVDFGDTTQPEGFSGTGCSNGTRGVWAAGSNPVISNILEYVTIASTGSAQDFGDLRGGLSEGAACSSPTRGVFFSGNGNGNAINYITIASTGNAQDFGDCIRNQSRGRGGSSNTIKGVFGGGYDQPSTSGNVIEYINIATIGNSIDFGDLSYSSRLLGSAANSTRAVFSGGVGTFNNIEYVTIPTNSNSIDFGNLTIGRHAANGLSNGHGGLG